jgi:hypothetical protein
MTDQTTMSKVSRAAVISADAWRRWTLERDTADRFREITDGAGPEGLSRAIGFLAPLTPGNIWVDNYTKH